jgi:p-aminobenzoyl-glutamate transporter AbgT
MCAWQLISEANHVILIKIYLAGGRAPCHGILASLASVKFQYQAYLFDHMVK